MHRITIIIVLLIISLPAFGNILQIDSLKQLHSIEKNPERKIELQLEIAKTYRYFILDSALVHASGALEKAKEIKRVQLQLDASIELIKSKIAKGSFDEALAISDSFIPTAIESQMNDRYAELLSLTGYIQRRKGRSELSEQSYLKCLDLSTNYSFNYGIALAKKGLGDLSERKAEYERAKVFYNEALEIAENENDPELQANIINAIGIIYDYQGRYIEAMEFYLNALGLSQSSGNLVKAAGISSNVASLQFTLHNDTLALKYYKLSLQLAEQSFSNSMMADALQGMSVVYNRLEDIKSAGDCAFKDLQLRLEMGDTRGLSYAYKNIGIYYFKLNDYTRSEEFLQKGLQFAIQTDQKTKIAVLCLELGRLFIQKKDAYKAIEYLGKGLKITEMHNIPREEGLFYDHLSICYAMLNKLDSTYHYRQLKKEIDEAVYTQEVQDATMRLEAVYQAKSNNEKIASLEKESKLKDKLLMQSNKIKTLSMFGVSALLLVSFLFYNRSRLKQKSNLLLLEKNAEIENQSNIISESLEEKEVLLKEIHHRVKNNLQIISSLLNLQSKNITDQALLDNITEGKNRVEAMSLIHQNLYQNEGLTRIDMQVYIEQLLNHLSISFKDNEKNITYQVKATAVVFDIDTAIPLGLIINELVSNAYKHAFKTKHEGEIMISLTPEKDDCYLLTVKDNGNGISDSIDIKKSKSLGLKLVHSLGVKQLKGELQISNSNGSRFDLHFKELDRKT